ncbi:MAG: hydantoinase/oxoprolinase family protein [Acidobacteriota bacterium]
MSRKIKIGIDVGGTFTHAVAVDIAHFGIVGKAVVPTSHSAKEGVARGVVESMQKLLETAHIHPDEVILIAHSTTQATNALLEGDVAPVGIIGMGTGLEGRRAKNETNTNRIELAPGKFAKTCHRFLDTGRRFDDETIRRTITELMNDGAQVIVASEAFGVDHPESEQRVVKAASAMGILATSASEISQLYGLRIRTRTAVINASMMPKMLETANMTEDSVRKSGINAPLMVMRSDGGIMDINEMRRRPILTMLSGPAAGVAAALMYIKISDGIFLEVGGTSTDISIIKNGKPIIRTAEIGGNKLFVRTLDVRTIGVAGGSMLRLHKGKVVDVGPRSAHIAGLKYATFFAPDEVPPVESLSLASMTPREGDPDDYVGIAVNGGAPSIAVTPTGAVNVLGIAQGYSKAKSEFVHRIFGWLASHIGTTPEKLATEIQEVCAAKNKEVIDAIIDEYKLDKSLLTLVGGGGGAEAIVPYTAKVMGMKHTIAENAEVISAIGIALGIIRDTIERTIINPTEQDLLLIRKEAMERIQRMGAIPETIEVTIDVDRQTKRVTAVATGSSELRTRDIMSKPKTDDELKAISAASIGSNHVELKGRAGVLRVFQGRREETRLFGLSKKTTHPLRVIDEDGIVRLQLAHGEVRATTVGLVTGTLRALLDEFTSYGDAGGLLPDVFIIASGRVIDLTGLVMKDQILSMAQAETEKISNDEPCIIIGSKKK